MHRIIAFSWLLIAIYGLCDYVWGSAWMANSIPMLFAISVYANLASHWSAAEASDE